ncbi:MAG: formate dehydrogenase [Saprospiraceae bacterium]|nr:formate dehydrogenase [Saprospiraceae bacterium]
MSRNISELSGRKGLEDNLFDKYGQLAQESGEPDKEELAKLAKEFLIGHANTYGATTFYDFLRPSNQGKKVYICNGSVCLCAGTQSSLEEKLASHFAKDQIGEMCCLGRCHENSAFQYAGHNYSGNDIANLDAIVEQKWQRSDPYQVKHHGKAILTSTQPTLTECVSISKSFLSTDSADVLDQIETSRLRGRGGAGFPIASKLQFCRQVEQEVKYIICNADEGDPGAYSDRYLLELQPYKTLLGMIIAGYVAGSNWGILYIRGEYPESVKSIENAIASFHSAGLAGDNIQGAGFDFHFKVIKAQGAYICGEETALINSIEGQRPEVRIRPPYPAQEGLFNKPTVVNNVETLAALPYILTHGGQAYASLGTASSSGTKLLSLDSAFRFPGIYEVEMGTNLSVVVEDLSGGFIKPVKALHIGGPLGGLVPMDKIMGLNVSFESFQHAGFLLGHASVVSVPTDFPMVKYLQHLFAFASHESCGKCFPCRLGTKRAEEMLEKAQNENYQIDQRLFDDLLHTLEEGSLCAHGGGIPLPVRNALMYFHDELSTYFKES